LFTIKRRFAVQKDNGRRCARARHNRYKHAVGTACGENARHTRGCSVVGGVTGLGGAAAKRAAGARRPDDPGQEPLELHEGRARGADGHRTRGHGVHAVPGRRPRQLHGGGHVRRPARETRPGPERDVGAAGQPGRVDARRPGHGQGVLRHGVHQRPSDGNAAGRARGRLRRDPRRAAVDRLHVVPVGRVRLAVDLRDTASVRDVPGARSRRTRAQSRVRVQLLRAAPRARHVRPTVHQRRTVGVQLARVPPRRALAQVHPAETLRPRVRVRPAVRDIHEHPPHPRAAETHHAARRPGRRHPSGRAARRSPSTYRLTTSDTRSGQPISGFFVSERLLGV